MTESNMLAADVQAFVQVANAATGLQQERGEIWQLWGASRYRRTAGY
jgi:hypothetical protein